MAEQVIQVSAGLFLKNKKGRIWLEAYSSSGDLSIHYVDINNWLEAFEKVKKVEGNE
jgi:hypothetical protein